MPALGNPVIYVTSAMPALGNRVIYITSAMPALGNRVIYVTSALPALANRRQNEFKDAQFQHFLALAPEVDKMSSRKLDLNIFRLRLQKSTK